MNRARHTLDAADGFIACRPRCARNKHKRSKQADGEEAQHGVVQGVAQPRPKARDRSHGKQSQNADDNPEPWPQPLEKQRPLAAPHLALERALQRGPREVGRLIVMSHGVKSSMSLGGCICETAFGLHDWLHERTPLRADKG